MVQPGEREGERERKKYEVDVTGSQSAQAAQGLGDVSALSWGLKGQSGFFKGAALPAGYQWLLRTTGGKYGGISV